VILTLLACTGSQPEPAPTQLPPEAPAPALEAAFEYRPPGVPLVPSARELHEMLAEQPGLSEAVAARAAEAVYKPDVVVVKIAATRTGAELGALFCEAGVADPKDLALRMTRITSGFEAIATAGPAVQASQDFSAFLLTDPDRDSLLAEMDRYRPLALDLLADHGGEEIIPLVLAGAWLQAYTLTAGGLLDVEAPERGHHLFYQPAVGAYFTTYTATVGGEVVPSGVLEPLDLALAELELRTQNDPMSTEDVAEVLRASESLLGML
jgi:hypothetical protein